MINKEAYQKNRRYMAWCALLVMAVVTIVVLIFPALVGAYFGFAKAIKPTK